MNKDKVKEAARDARWWIAVVAGLLTIYGGLVSFKILDRPAMAGELQLIRSEVKSKIDGVKTEVKNLRSRMYKYQRSNLCVSVGSRMAINDLQLSIARREKRQYVSSGTQIPAAVEREINRLSLTRTRLLSLRRKHCN